MRDRKKQILEEEILMKAIKKDLNILLNSRDGGKLELMEMLRYFLSKCESI